MEELCRVTKQSGADLVVTSSWRQHLGLVNLIQFIQLTVIPLYRYTSNGFSMLFISTVSSLSGFATVNFAARFETARNVLAEHLSRYGLHIKDWTTTAGGESNEARVNQILSYVTALDVAAWAVVDDEVSCLVQKKDRGAATGNTWELVGSMRI